MTCESGVVYGYGMSQNLWVNDRLNISLESWWSGGILEFSTHYTHLEIKHMHTYTCIRLNNIGNRCWYSSNMHNFELILCMIDSLTFFRGVV